MTCISVHELIQPLLDQELDPSQKAGIEGHLRGCVTCAEFHHELTELRKAIRNGVPYFQAPRRLEVAIRDALRSADRTSTSGRMPWAWVAAAVSLGFATVMIWGIVALQARGSQQDLMAQEVVASHVRSLMAGHLLDVPTSDQHTVKPWFNGKLDFSPQMEDLSDEGFPLTGGRLDYLDHRAVAALVYKRRQHVINLFILPSAHSTGSRIALAKLNGFNIVHWTEQGFAHWAVSDVGGAELLEFARLCEK